jgi:transposase
MATQMPSAAVAVKTEAQQAVLALHRMRQQKVKFRTAQTNGLRRLLTEYGEVMSKSRAALDKAIPAVLAGLAERLPATLIDSLASRPDVLLDGIQDWVPSFLEIFRVVLDWVFEERRLSL